MFTVGARVTFTFADKPLAGIIKGVNAPSYAGKTTATRKATLRDLHTKEPLGAYRSYYAGNPVTFNVTPGTTLAPGDTIEVPLAAVGSITPEMVAEMVVGGGTWAWDKATVPVVVTSVVETTYQVFGQWGANEPPLEEVDALDGARGEIYLSVPAANIRPRV